MCITCSTKLMPRIAKRDIVSYKAMYISSDGTVVSPFVPSRYVIGETKHIKIAEMHKHAKLYRTSSGLYSFPELKRAALAAKVVTDKKSKAYVFRCVIPKGSLYIRHMKQIISDHIIIKEQIPE